MKIIPRNQVLKTPQGAVKTPMKSSTAKQSKGTPKESVDMGFSTKTKNFLRDAAGLAAPILTAASMGTVFASSPVVGLGAAAVAIGSVMGVAVSALTGHLFGKATAVVAANTVSTLTGQAVRNQDSKGLMKAGGITGAAWGLGAGVALAAGMGPGAVVGLAGLGAGLAVAAFGLESAVTGTFGVPMGESFAPS